MIARFGLVACGILLVGCSVEPVVDGPLSVSGGGTTGIYYSYGSVLATALGAEFEVDATVLETGGSIENLHNLADGSALIAFSAGDVAGDAAAGRPPFDEPLPVQAAARVYDDFVHLIVLADSPVMAIEHLRGRTVSLGASGSGTEVIARRLLAEAGIDVAEIDNAELGIDGSIEALQRGQIDAFFWSGGLPTPGVAELADAFDIRLVDLSRLVEDLRDEYGSGYRHGVVPQGTYGLAQDVRTLAVPNFLMVRSDASDDLVYQTLVTLFRQQSTIAAEVPAAALLDQHRAIYTEPVDLHPGALAYFRDIKP